MTDENSFERLEMALVRAGREFEYPATPAIALRVRQELGRAEVRPAPKARRERWRMVVPIAAAIVLALALLLAFPDVREAVAQLLGLRGLRIFYVTPTAQPSPPTPLPQGEGRTPAASAFARGGERTLLPPATAGATPTQVSPEDTRTATPMVQPSPTPTKVALCCPVSLQEAQRRARFKLLVPSGEQASQVYYQDIYGNGEQVIMVFGDHDKPRFTFYQAQQWVYGKLLNGGLGKQVDPSTVIGEAQVRGQRALWFSGAPHVLVTLDGRGEPIYSTARTVDANTLVWETGNEYDGIIYRVETKLPLADAVQFAESLR